MILFFNLQEKQTFRNMYQLFFMFYVITGCVQGIEQRKGSNSKEKCVCGVSSGAAGSIIGGNKVRGFTYPWIAIINKNGRMHCSGSVINDRYILTAAHCFNNTPLKALVVVLGVFNKGKPGKFKVVKELDRMIEHDKHEQLESHDIFDIGLLRTRQKIQFNAAVRPVCLPRVGTKLKYTGRMAEVIGFGKTSSTGVISRVLKMAQVKVQSHEKCKKSEAGPDLLDTMLCAYELKADACQGDSGGPLMIKAKNGRYVEIGIVSWGIGCGIKGIPGVYTRVTKFLKWIKSKTKDATYCTTGNLKPRITFRTLERKNCSHFDFY